MTSEPCGHEDKEMVSISKTEFDRLIQDQKWLQALEAAGVDNWEGCEQAQDLLGD